MADYDRAVTLDPNYAPAWFGRGMIYKARNQTAQALEDFNRAIALRSDDAEALYNRGVLHQGERQYQPAIDDFSSAHGLVPQQVELSRPRPGQGGRCRSRRGGAERSTERTALDEPRPRL